MERGQAERPEQDGDMMYGGDDAGNELEGGGLTVRDKGRGEWQNPETFNHPSIWLTRLTNVVNAISETQNDAMVQLLARDNFFDTILIELSELQKRLNNFELFQIDSLYVMLGHMWEFGQEHLSHYTNKLLPPDWDEVDMPPTDLLRRAYHELSTDLQILQSAVAQRLWDAVPTFDQDVDAETITAILEMTPSEFERLMARDEEADLYDEESANYNAAVAAYSAIIAMGSRSNQAETLLYADIFAAELFRTAQHLLPGEMNENSERLTVEIVTYFTQSMHVRILPYYPDNILIGLPYSSGYTDQSQLTEEMHVAWMLDEHQVNATQASLIPWEFLSLPHEIGHYLFWNGCTPIDPTQTFDVWLKDQLVNGLGIQPSDWRFYWLEEVFADVYNCLILGSAAVLGLQVYLSDGAPEDWFADNGLHPIPAIRPFLGCMILERIAIAHDDDGYLYENTIPLLVDNWEGILDLHGLTGELESIEVGNKPSNKGGGLWHNHCHKDQQDEEPVEVDIQVLSYGMIETQLVPVIDKILEVLVLSSSAESRNGSLPWVQDVAEGDRLPALFAQLPELLRIEQAEDVPVRKFVKRTQDYVDMRGLIDFGLDDGYRIAQELKAKFIDHWGDKGPKGDPVDPDNAWN